MVTILACRIRVRPFLILNLKPYFHLFQVNRKPAKFLTYALDSDQRRKNGIPNECARPTAANSATAGAMIAVTTQQNRDQHPAAGMKVPVPLLVP